jgi:hypothetical protein
VYIHLAILRTGELMRTALDYLPERPAHQVKEFRKRYDDSTRVTCTCGAVVTTDTIQEAAAWWSIHRDSA